ncbi:uncharacterized protein LOC109857472 isoform X2 [Pseudomyrmex gracilis]|uniref:uncharacterized protein LOC109857472 isoform X2 n=1 Tax=Pseudomyrmex gracilis TaxID=219809 RepID=UPI000995AA27|nr:uncharacterized protein LOC109857472 isoform X2 [Pseudomyrmex gracilis]
MANNQNEPSFEEEPREGTSSKTEQVQVEVKVDKKKKQDLDVQENLVNISKIFDFSDGDLLRVLKTVDKKVLKNLRLCCERLSMLMLDESLWILDHRKEPMIPSQMLPYENFLEPLTHSLAVRGDFERNIDNILGHLFFYKLQEICRLLKELIIEDYYINIHEVTMQQFPKTIEKLELKNCIAYSDYFCQHFSFTSFSEICLFMPNLRCLILDNMIWRITPKSLRDIGELTHLKELRITSCFRIHTFHPEIDIHTFKCNFKTLEILDLQNTAVEIRLFEWLCQIKTLKHLYLQCPTYLKKEWSDELLEDFKKLYYKQKFVPLKMFDKLLYDFHSKVESLSGENKIEEIINYRNYIFQDYFMSNISKYTLFACY